VADADASLDSLNRFRKSTYPLFHKWRPVEANSDLQERKSAGQHGLAGRALIARNSQYSSPISSRRHFSDVCNARRRSSKNKVGRTTFNYSDLTRKIQKMKYAVS
jgi:hypothetical protein